ASIQTSGSAPTTIAASQSIQTSGSRAAVASAQASGSRARMAAAGDIGRDSECFVTADAAAATGAVQVSRSAPTALARGQSLQTSGSASAAAAARDIVQTSGSAAAEASTLDLRGAEGDVIERLGIGTPSPKAGELVRKAGSASGLDLVD